MADILGAAAGCGMIFLVFMLVGCFLAEIRLLQRNTVLAWGWVLVCCSLFAIAQYGLMIIVRIILYGNENNLYRFAEIVQHRKFLQFRYSDGKTARYAITFSVLMMAAAGICFYETAKYLLNREKAKKSVILFYLLPGMSYLFMPGCHSWALALICAALFAAVKIIGKKIKMKFPAWAFYGLAVVFGILRCFDLLRFVTGV